MRLSPIVVVTLVGIGLAGVVTARARADGEAPDVNVRLALMADQVAALKADVELLRHRDAYLTDRLAKLAAASAGLRTGITQARGQGFEQGAIPTGSRVTLLATLETLSTDLAAGGPGAPSSEELELRRRADELRKVWTR